MQKILLFFILGIVFNSRAEGSDRALTLDYNIDSVVINTTLAKGRSRVVVHVNNEDCIPGERILYGYEPEGFEAYLDSEKSFEFEVDSGMHVFQFYAGQKIGYGEITTHGGIHVESGTTTYMSLTFRIVEVHFEVRKPVIYLYPTEKTEVTVSVQAKGEMSFMYPPYNDQWECTALPSGELFIDENSYNYLFWEAEQTLENDQLINMQEQVVLKDDLLEFLESSLEKFGFTSKESMDFITFWVPQMLSHEATGIRFLFNEDCALFADLNIEPKPDNLLRFYMIWNPLDTFYYDENVKIQIPKQTRNGFTVLEWGGMEIPRGDRLERLPKSASVKN